MKRILLLATFVAMGAFLSACGSSDKAATDPNALLKKVQSSQLGSAYAAYAFFANVKWTPVSDQQKGNMIQFEGLYDMGKVARESCSKTVAEKGPEAVKDLEKISQMTHTAMFGLKDGGVDVRFSGWSLVCANGAQKNFSDPDMNTQKEIVSNAWYTDCETLLMLATKVCAQ